METEQRAKEILNYCENYLIKDSEERINFKISKLHKEMIKEVSFFIDND